MLMSSLNPLLNVTVVSDQHVDTRLALLKFESSGELESLDGLMVDNSISSFDGSSLIQADEDEQYFSVNLEKQRLVIRQIELCVQVSLAQNGKVVLVMNSDFNVEVEIPATFVRDDTALLILKLKRFGVDWKMVGSKLLLQQTINSFVTKIKYQKGKLKI